MNETYSILELRPGDKPLGLAYPLSYVKEHLRVTGTDQDGVIGRMINAAADWIEHNCWIVLASRSYVGYLNEFRSEVAIPRGPVSAVSSVTYYDSDNAQQTLATSSYWSQLNTDNPRIYFEDTPTTYDDRYEAVQINLTIGYTQWENIPDEVVQLLMLIVSDYYDHRGTTAMAATHLIKSPAIMRLAQNLSKRLPT